MAHALPVYDSSLWVWSVCILWILPPLCNSWIKAIIQLYIPLYMTPNVDCFRVRRSTQCTLEFFGGGFRILDSGL